MIHIAGLQLGDKDALATLQGDKERRRDKAKALRELREEWREVEEKAAYLLKTGDSIRMLKPAIVTKALGEVEDTIESFIAEKRQR